MARAIKRRCFCPVLSPTPSAPILVCQHATHQKNTQNACVIKGQHHTKNQQIENRKKDAQSLHTQKILYPALVAHALHEVAYLFALKIAHRQTHNPRQKIGNEADVQPCAEM